jgi:hypothetical protein
MIKEMSWVVVVARDITDQKSETELIEAKVFAELATGIAEEKINAENAAVIAENVKAKQQFCQI